MRYALILAGFLILASHHVTAAENVSFKPPLPSGDVPIIDAQPVDLPSCFVTLDQGCDDNDPCTKDVCVRKRGSSDIPEFNGNGVCQHVPLTGDECADVVPPTPPVVGPVDPPAEPAAPTADPVAEEPMSETPASEEPAPVSAPQPVTEGPICGNGSVEDGEECDGGPACDVECRFNIAAFPDCRIPEDELRAMEPSQLIGKYGYGEFEKCALAGGGAGGGLENAAKNLGASSSGCSLAGADARSPAAGSLTVILFSIVAVFAGLAFRIRQNGKENRNKKTGLVSGAMSIALQAIGADCED